MAWRRDKGARALSPIPFYKVASIRRYGEGGSLPSTFVADARPRPPRSGFLRDLLIVEISKVPWHYIHLPYFGHSAPECVVPSFGLALASAPTRNTVAFRGRNLANPSNKSFLEKDKAEKGI